MYSSIIASIAIVLTIINLILLYTHNKKTLKPYLLINTDLEVDEAFIEIYLINKGVGPAIITDFNLFYKGNPIDASDYKYLIGKIDELALNIANKKGLSDSLDIRRSLREIENDRTVLAVNERIRFLRVESKHFEIVRELMANIKINCEYKSIYNQKDTVDYKSGIK